MFLSCFFQEIFEELLGMLGSAGSGKCCANVVLAMAGLTSASHKISSLATDVILQFMQSGGLISLPIKTTKEVHKKAERSEVQASAAAERHGGDEAVVGAMCKCESEVGLVATAICFASTHNEYALGDFFASYFFDFGSNITRYGPGNGSKLPQSW